MFQIFIDNDVTESTYDFTTIYDPEHFDDGYSAYDISISRELSRAGSLKFTIAAGHPSYNDITPLKSTVVVRYDGRTIWFGRVVSVSRDFYLNKTVNCEEALAFLGDILIKPFLYRAGTTYYGSTVSNHLNNITSMYLSRCSEKRKFPNVTGTLPDDFGNIQKYAVYGVDAYRSVFDELTGICEYDSSVYITLGYTTLGVPSLVIGKMPYAVSDSTIEAGVNLVNLSDDTDCSGLFSSVIPLDENNGTLPGNAYYVDNTSLVNQYGVIEKSLNLGNLSNVTTVRNFCIAVSDRSAETVIPKINVTALDMFYLSQATVAIEPGVLVHIASIAHGINAYYLCKSVQINPEQPENASYVFSYYGTEPDL